MAEKPNDEPPRPQAPLARERDILVLAIYFIVLVVLMAYLLVALWPERAGDAWDNKARLFGISFSIGFETRLILLVIVAGALGSYVHAATSFSTYVGNRTLVASWIWWYFLRTPIGVVLALLFYFVMRGGLLSAGASGDVLSPFGVAAVAGLVGMFSKQATDKLRELFDNLFRTAPGKGDAERKDKVETNPVPKLTAIQPTSFKLGASGGMLELTGSNFVKNSVVRVNSADRPTTFVSGTLLTAELAANDLATAGSVKITVFNPAPGGGASEAVTVTVA